MSKVQTDSLRYLKRFGRISLPDFSAVLYAVITWKARVGFNFLIGSSRRPSHESNVYAILNLIAEPASNSGLAAKALLSNPI